MQLFKKIFFILLLVQLPVASLFSQNKTTKPAQKKAAPSAQKNYGENPANIYVGTRPIIYNPVRTEAVPESTVGHQQKMNKPSTCDNLDFSRGDFTNWVGQTSVYPNN